MHIKDIITSAPEKKEKPTQGGINSKRSWAVSQLIKFMGESIPTPEEKEKAKKDKQTAIENYKKRIQQRTGYWLGRTRKLTPDEIIEMMNRAKDGKNRAALFNYFLKNHGKQI